MTERRRLARDALLHPVVLIALLVWIINDHWAKAAHGGVITGKLSDVVSLIVFPLLPVAALEMWRGRRGAPMPGAAWTYVWLIATGAVMATINLFDSAAWAYRHGLAVAQWPFHAIASTVRGDGLPALHPVALWMDPTDLLTLPALVVPWLLQRRIVSSPHLRAPNATNDLHVTGSTIASRSSS